MKQIRFWYEKTEKALIVVHIRSGKKKRLEGELAEVFLNAHGLTLAKCKEMQERADVTNLFRMNI